MLKLIVGIGFGIVLAVLLLAGLPAFLAGLHPAVSAIRAASTSNSPAPPATNGAQWKYTRESDDMNVGASYLAEVDSVNTLEFGFPYAGPQHARLTLRTHPRYGKNVILQIERGQFLCWDNYDGCTVLVRFDDEKPMHVGAARAADGSTTTLFLRSYSLFATKLPRAKRVRVEAKVYQEGNPVLEFDVTGFDQGKYMPQQKRGGQGTKAELKTLGHVAPTNVEHHSAYFFRTIIAANP